MPDIMFPISAKENMIISSMIMPFRSEYILIPQDRDDLGYCIAAARRSLLGDQLGPDAQQRKLILAKLIHNAGDRADAYVVTKELKAVLLTPAMQRLVPQYLKKVMGQHQVGCWGNGTFEAVVHALAYASSTGRPAVFPRNDLISLLQTYKGQEADARQAAANLAPQKRDMKGVMVAAAGDASTSMSERKASSRDGQGRCFMCDAVKPRGVTCRICFYTPRGA